MLSVRRAMITTYTAGVIVLGSGVSAVLHHVIGLGHLRVLLGQSDVYQSPMDGRNGKSVRRSAFVELATCDLDSGVFRAAWLQH